jgi:hypothetical protein
MSLTLFSLFLLPLCLIWIATPERLLQLAAVVSCFEAAAAVTIGNYGLQPGLLPAVLFMAYMTLQLLLGARYPAAPAVWEMFRPLALVALYGVVTAYLMPRLFSDQIYVWPQKLEPPYDRILLTIPPGYPNQTAYLTLDCAFTFLSALYLSRPGRSMIPFINAFFLSGFVVAAVSFWQFASKMFGVPFPDSLFFSNPSWAVLTQQTVGSLPRINGPFAEPAGLAGFMAAIVCASGWLLLKGRRDPLLWPLFAAGLATIALSTSTTGFAALAVIAVVVPVRALLTGSRRMIVATLQIGLPLLLIGGMAVLLAGILIPSFNADMQDVLMISLTKQDSSSYMDRTQADLDSLGVMLDTYGLGVGWGNNRSSSLIPGILAEIGLPGAFGLVWFGVGLQRRIRSMAASVRWPASCWPRRSPGRPSPPPCSSCWWA